LRQRASRERNAADGLAGLERADLGDNTPLAQISHQEVETAELKIAADDRPDPLRFSLIDRDLSTLGIVAERGHASDPEPFALGCRDFVADALGSDFALELGKGQQDVEVSRPIEVVVLNCWVTETNDTLCWSNSSTSLAKSANERVSRSTL
jgi:hypothetical protein